TTWSQPANWLDDALPEPGDDVYIPDVSATTSIVLSTSTLLRGLISDEPIVINSGGTLNISAPSQLNAGGELDAGGTLIASGDLTIGGTFNWTGGTIQGGPVTISGDWTISGDSTKALSSFGATLNNAGTVVWTGAGDLDIFGFGVFNNLAGATFE